MKHRFAMMGLQIKTLLAYAIITVCAVAISVGQASFWERIAPADMYSRLLSLSVGVMASWAYAALQAKSLQQLLAAGVIARFTSRLSCSGFILRRNLYCAVPMAIFLNLATVLMMKDARSFDKAFVPTLLLCLIFQIVYFFVIATFEQVLFLLLRNWYTAFFITVFCISLDPFLITLQIPFQFGWGVTLLPLNGLWQQAVITFALLLCGVTIVFVFILSRADLLHYDKKVAK